MSKPDAPPYTSLPSPERAPDRLAVLGRLFGLQPPAITRCRVLELGAGSGADLLALAQMYPDASFVGIDLDPASVEEARATAAAMGVGNIEMKQCSILDLDRRTGQFDYIICHGVYSWVPENVQEKILQVCADHLAEQGVAYVSYNALPAWSYRSILRQALRRLTARAQDGDGVHKAKEGMRLMLRVVEEAVSPYALALKLELENTLQSSDGFILNELLAEQVSACYLDEFAARARRHSLHYITEARFDRVLSERLDEIENSSDLRSLLADMNSRDEREQMLDFLYPTWLRQAVLTRAAPPRETASPEVLGDLWAASSLVPADPHEGVDVFVNPRGASVSVPDKELQAALRELIAVWPSWIRVTELHQRVCSADADQSSFGSLAAQLLTLFSRGVVELHSAAPVFACAAGERPMTPPLARQQLKRQRWVTNLRHEYVVLSDLEQEAAALIDGTRSKTEIVKALAERCAAGQLELREEYKDSAGGENIEELIAEGCEEVLRRFAENALLMEPKEAAGDDLPSGRKARSSFSRFMSRFPRNSR